MRVRFVYDMELLISLSEEAEAVYEIFYVGEIEKYYGTVMEGFAIGDKYYVIIPEMYEEFSRRNKIPEDSF